MLNNQDEIKRLISDLQIVLKELGKRKGLSDPEVLQTSRELNELLVKYYKLIKEKKE